jgi:lysozyme
MKLTQAAIDLVKGFETLRLKAYPDPATGAAPWTIGYGATGADVKPGVVWTQDQAEKRLQSDLDHVAYYLKPLLKVTLSDNEFGALVSLGFIGIGNLKSSTLLKLVNASDFDGAANEFVKWNKADGKAMKGLTRRRQAEALLFKS